MLNDLTDDRAPQPPVILDTDLDLVAAVAGGRRPARPSSRRRLGFSVFLDDQLETAINLMRAEGVAHLVVRDEHRSPVGVSSMLDVAGAIADAPPGEDAL